MKMKHLFRILAGLACLPVLGLVTGMLASFTVHLWMFGWNLGTAMISAIHLFG